MPTSNVALRFSLVEVSQKTKIPVKHLTAIEEGNLSALPSGSIYRKSALKKYASATGVDCSVLFEQFKDQLGEDGGARVLVQCTDKKSFLNIPRIIARSVVIIVGLVVLAYVGLQVKNILRVPLLQVESPVEGAVATQSLFVVKGVTEQETQISVNGEEIYTGTDGVFSEAVSLHPGINEIRVKATKKHGRTSEVVRRVVLEESVQ